MREGAPPGAFGLFGVRFQQIVAPFVNGVAAIIEGHLPGSGRSTLDLARPYSQPQLAQFVFQRVVHTSPFETFRGAGAHYDRRRFHVARAGPGSRSASRPGSLSLFNGWRRLLTTAKSVMRSAEHNHSACSGLRLRASAARNTPTSDLPSRSSPLYAISNTRSKGVQCTSMTSWASGRRVAGSSAVAR